MKTRVLTALVLLAIVLAAFAAPSAIPIVALAAIASFLAAAEAPSLISGLPKWAPWVMSCFAAGLVATSSAVPMEGSFGVALVVLLAAGATVTLAKKPAARAIGLTLYASIPLACLAAFHSHSAFDGWSLARPSIAVMVPLWLGDTAAIFAGKAFGKHLLAPNISPKKTVEGGVANLIFCIIGAFLLMPFQSFTPLAAICIGLSAGVLGQAGDLLESHWKRAAGAKDSGGLLPGHGGILDRIDSLLLSAIPSLLSLHYLSR